MTAAPAPESQGGDTASATGGVDSADVVTWAGLAVPRGTVVWALVAVATLLAFGLRLEEVLRPGHLLGVVQYDDAVYFGAAVRIANGALPYRNFVLIQPPGLPLLLAPVGLVSRLIGVRDGMGVARLMQPVVCAVDVFLVGWLLRHRSPLVVGAACLALAAYPDDLLSAPTVYQEPYLNLFCLLGAICVFEGDRLTDNRRSLLLGGLAFGVAGSVKVWAIFPVLILALLLLRHRPQRLIPFAAGVAGSFLLVCLPFLIAAGPTFVHEILVVQLTRTDVARVPVLVRLVYMTGVVITNAVQITALQKELGLVVAGGLAATLAAAYLFFPRPAELGPEVRRGWRSRFATTELERYVLGSAVLIVLAFMVPSDFYFHYATFLGPFLMIALGLALARVAPVVREPAVGVTALVLLVALMHAFLVARGLGPAPDPFRQIDRAIPAGVCVVTDNPAYLINADRYVSTDANCPPTVDPFGVTLSRSGGMVADGGAARVPRAVATWRGYFERAGYLLLGPASGRRIPWTAGLEVYVHAHFMVVTDTPVLILRRGDPQGTAPYALPGTAPS